MLSAAFADGGGAGEGGGPGGGSNAGAGARSGDIVESVEADIVRAMPPLGNTPEGDRSMLLEVGDDHVHHARRGGVAASVRTAPEPLASPAPQTSGAPAFASAWERMRDIADGAPLDGGPGGGPGVAADGSNASPRPAPGPGGTVPPALDDVWTRVRDARRLTIPDNEAVQGRLRVLRDETRWISEILHRGTPYVAYVVDALDARSMPLELALLPAVESGFRPSAESLGQAAGLWQIMPVTAREIGLERSDWYDPRADVVASTTAALDYLSQLNAAFHGDWELTLAAYNAGPGRVRRAVRRNERAARPTDFWSLDLPAETRAYVPKLLALVALLREGPADGLDVPSVSSVPAFERIDVGRRVSLERAADLVGLERAVLRDLNPGLVHGVTPPGGPHALYVPRAARSRAIERLAGADPSALFSEPASHTVVAGDTLGALALAYGTSEATLRALNALDGSRIRVGQRLAVLGTRSADGERIEHVVRRGDTLSDIAQRYAVGLGAISRGDGAVLASDVIHPGETLLVDVPRAVADAARTPG